MMKILVSTWQCSGKLIPARCCLRVMKTAASARAGARCPALASATRPAEQREPATRLPANNRRHRAARASLSACKSTLRVCASASSRFPVFLSANIPICSPALTDPFTTWSRRRAVKVAVAVVVALGPGEAMS